MKTLLGLVGLCGIVVILFSIYAWYSLGGNADYLKISALLMFGLLLLGLSIYFIRTKCPDCGKRRATKLSEAEVDRWRGSKKVDVKNKKGEVIGTRTIAVDYGKFAINWQCKNCGHQFSTFKKREL